MLRDLKALLAMTWLQKRECYCNGCYRSATRAMVAPYGGQVWCDDDACFRRINPNYVGVVAYDDLDDAAQVRLAVRNLPK